VASIEYPDSANYTDADGHLWVQAMRHAGVIYPPDTPIVARGKLVSVKGNFVERGETQLEGWTDTENNITHLEHINFPYNAGDVLLIATEQQTSNKIEPVLTWTSLLRASLSSSTHTTTCLKRWPSSVPPGASGPGS
jgi:hypothetical protein